MKRGCGIYLPIRFLPNAYGKGCMSKEAYEFVDFLAEHNIKYWNVGDIHAGGNKYVSAQSKFALDPMLIDTEDLLVKDELDFFVQSREMSRDKYIEVKGEMLRYIFVKHYMTTNIDKFIEDNENWVYDYAVYLALKEELGCDYNGFENCYKNLDSAETINFIKQRSEEIIFYIFSQYICFKQWKKLKKYANSKGVKIIIEYNENTLSDSSDYYSKPHFYKSLGNGYYAFDNDVVCKDNYQWLTDNLKFNSKLSDYVIINTAGEKLNMYSCFNLSSVKTLKNNSVKNIIFSKIGNNLCEDVKTTKMSLSFTNSLADEFLKAYENGEKPNAETLCNDKTAKNTVLSACDYDITTLSELLKNADVKEKFISQLSVESINADVKTTLKLSIEKLLASNADICVLDMRDLVSLDDSEDNKSSENETCDNNDNNENLDDKTSLNNNNESQIQDSEQAKEHLLGETYETAGEMSETGKTSSSEQTIENVNTFGEEKDENNQGIAINNNITKESKGEFQLTKTYQSEKYFEYLKQLVANKNR